MSRWSFMLELKAFGSYAHTDQTLADQLNTRVADYFRADDDFRISDWQDVTLLPTDDWGVAIQGAIDATTVAFLYVSPAFLASESFRAADLDQLLSSPGKVIVPVLLTPVDLKRFELGEQTKRQIFTLGGLSYSERPSQRGKFEFALYQKVHDRLTLDYPDAA